ncbi:hypothetical protein YC2023_079850 [Brassica napus]
MSLESGVEPKGVIATNINPKLVGDSFKSSQSNHLCWLNFLTGRLFQNATSGTNLYLDNKCGASSSFIKE